ncbi:hypothetical protein [Undibacterium sp. TS12]|uniref:hypothetical protein n=1 Tax=Undibacterium sp. TS12 TaxID=2908202 RepID=UPI001F4CD9BF|nr:hypothetical protein [Undibacterium sp. TS12]MCH8621582.1 hypothetical protein [Undibacterium sp. TS12]
MSGPTTVIISGDPLLILLSAAAIRAALVIAQAHQNANALNTRQIEQQTALQNQLQAAALQGRQALQEQLQLAEQEFAQLSALAEKIGCSAQVLAARPVLPAIAENEQELLHYVHALKTLAYELRPVLLEESARRADALFDDSDANLQTASAAALPQSRLARLLKRIAHIQDIPQNIQELAKELEQALPGERADLLASELRVQIQALLAAEQKRQVDEAQALILEQTLQDLGYQVEEIGHTLFVDGGVVHFRRSSWDKYMVRMRIDAKSGQANFNVIRAVKEGENERSVLDHLAEDRWCSEFPALMAALEARGIHMQVTRLLQAGELPVQLVVETKLPQFAEEEQTESHTRLMAKKLP